MIPGYGPRSEGRRGPWPRRVARYLRAAPLPHLSSILALCVAGVCGGAGQAAFEGGIATGGWMLSGMASGWVLAAVLCQADACGRYREYRRVKAILARRGFCRRTLRVMSGSRCRRDAALLAAGETGHRARAARYFRELGYRGRHVVPDMVAADPRMILDRRFLRATFVPGKRLRNAPKRSLSPQSPPRAVASPRRGAQPPRPE